MTLRRRKQTDAPNGDGRRREESAEPLFVSEPMPPDQSPEPKDRSPDDRPRQTEGDDGSPSLLDQDIPEMDVRDALEPKERRLLDLRGDRWRWVTIGILGLVAVFALTQAFGGDDEPAAPPDAAAATSTTATSAAPVTATPVVTTLPPVATSVPPPPTTTAPTTTTSTTTSTTTTTTEPPPFIAVVGDPIPVEDLEMSINGIGPLDFGDPADQVLGRLAASLGQPTADYGTVTDGSLGTCDEGTFHVVEWGPLIVITRWENAEESFDMYRVDLRVDDPTGPAAELRTLSGFRAGMTIAELEDIYLPGFRIAYTDHPVEGEIFELRGASGLLLWGPITSSEDDGIVQGIFSEQTC